MQSVIRKVTKVLPGGRIEICNAPIKEGTSVEVLLLFEQTAPIPGSISDFFASLPDGPRSADSWDEFEELFRKEREAWEP